MISSKKDIAVLKKLYFLYVFFLPMGSFIKVPEGSLGTFLHSMSLNIMIIGMLVIFIKDKHRSISSGVTSFVRLYGFMVLYSVVAASILTISLSVNSYTKTPYDCIMGDIVLNGMAVLSVYFNYYCLTNVVNFKSLYKVFDLQIIISLLFGFLQIGAVLGVGICPTIYAGLASVLNIMTVETLIKMERGITLFGSEPAVLTVYCFFIIPYLLYNIFYLKQKVVWYTIIFFSFMVIFVASLSSQAILVLLTTLSSFIFLSVSKKFLPILRVGAFCSGLFLAFATTYSEYLPKYDDSAADGIESFAYVVLGKAVDQDNLSTQMRASAIINDMKLFSSNILWGVGDGCQGYWYKDNVPSWCRSSEEVNDLISQKAVPNGGGAFFPDFLSAYGLIGVIFLISFLLKYSKCVNKSILKEEELMEIIYQIGSVIMLMACWYTVIFREYPIAMFLLSLPLCSTNLNKKTI